MFDISGHAAVLRRAALVGAAALTLGGLTVTAQALPVAPAPSAASALSDVQYHEDGYRHHGYRHHGYRHHRDGSQHMRHPGRAGLYNCGPGERSTRLARKACGRNNRFQHLQGY